MVGSPTFKSPTRTGIHHYADLFATNGWDVFFLSSQLSPVHFIRKEDRVYSKEKIRLWARGGEWENNIFSYSYFTVLPILPFWSSDFFVRNTLKFTLPRLSKVLEKHGFSSPDVIWIENPHFVELPSMVNYKVLLFRINDELSGFEGNSSFIVKRYQATIKTADLVITTAKRLYNRNMNLGCKVLYLPNGVNPDHFIGNLPEPEEYKDIPSPRILYAGVIATWFDQELLIQCAKKFMDASFVIIGPAVVGTSKMASVENIYMLGAKKYEELPAYLMHSDVGIIPFKINELVESVNPIKLYEYMAAGLPVVCTDWKEVREMQGPAMIAGDAGAFCEYLQRALEIKEKGELVSYARSNSWESRFQKIVIEIERVGPPV
ncbi:MAG: glycosyltransferase [Desulfobulbaceae bacterium]|nr:glycosyltransferase [Desulfobulbaceae bacterium]